MSDKREEEIRKGLEALGDEFMRDPDFQEYIQRMGEKKVRAGLFSGLEEMAAKIRKHEPPKGKD